VNRQRKSQNSGDPHSSRQLYAPQFDEAGGEINSNFEELIGKYKNSLTVHVIDAEGIFYFGFICC
jgi:hypothetical protein